MMARAWVVAAAVAVVAAGVAAGPARADGYGPYDFAGGRWYADEQRDQQRLGYDAYGRGRAWQPFYPGAVGAYSYGVPGYVPMPSADYSYGAYAPSAPDNTARIRLIVPAGARVWFGNSATQQTGSVRNFESPRLMPGKDYTYDVKATWTEDGKEVTRTRQVSVAANRDVTVDLTTGDASRR